jgi:hypothetical protein
MLLNYGGHVDPPECNMQCNRSSREIGLDSMTFLRGAPRDAHAVDGTKKTNFLCAPQEGEIEAELAPRHWGRNTVDTLRKHLVTSSVTK